MTAIKPLYRPFFFRRLTLILLGLLLVIMIAVLLFPIRFGSLRLLLLVGWPLLWLGVMWLSWKRRPLRFAGIALAIVVACFILGPGRAMDRALLRDDYLSALRGYKDTPYLWGGECRRGIDCSGLVRRGMIDATLRQGLTKLNPAAVRAALELWFFDSSAQAMGNEYRGRTQFLFAASALNALDQTSLQPGDFAVTRSGVHTLAYLGNGEWIQADPGAGKVITNSTPSRNAWFGQPMKIMRWQLLE